MQGILDSFQPLLEKYKIEVFLIASALIVTTASVFIFLNANKTNQKSQGPLIKEAKNTKIAVESIVVDLAGAVEKPDTYEVRSGARLKDVLVQAGGLSGEADRLFFAKNFNLARILGDQEKIYIPSTEETEKGVVTTVQAAIPANSGQTLGASSKLNINSATMDELDTLSGVGKVTAQKIIQNRPYSKLEDLVNKKVIYQSVFTKIKDSIEL